ncbi:hypothetical protein BDC45DRAFT_582931 [Circinella umbellata]|nr:hypothetical protein BDC45DRAFT_582931 [Circinella umbellata]
MSSSNVQDNTNNNTPTQETRRVDREGDVNMEMGRLSITEQDGDQEHQTSLRTYLHLKQQVKEADVKYQEAIENNEVPKEQDKNLPVLQIVGSDKWHPNKIIHLSTEMFLRAFEKEIRAANLKVQDNWSRLLPKSFNDAQNIWLDGVLQEYLSCTWDEVRVKIVEQFDKPEQRLKSMESVLHMRQRHGEKVKTYARKFHQRCIESGLDKYPEVMIVALLSSLEKKNDVYDLVAAKFSSDILKQSMNDMVNYVAGLQLDSTENNKRSREDDAATTRPIEDYVYQYMVVLHYHATIQPTNIRIKQNTIQILVFTVTRRENQVTPVKPIEGLKVFRWQHQLQEAAIERVERLMFNKKLTTELMMVFLVS